MPIRCHLAAAALLVAAGTASACPEPCDPGSPPPEWRVAGDRFRVARDAGDVVAADAAALEYVRLLQKNDIQVGDDVVEYWIFSRQRCDAHGLASDRLGAAQSLLDGAVACEAARDPAAAATGVQALFDVRAATHAWRSDVFDRFARQPTLDIAALQWLRLHRLDDRTFTEAEESALVAQVRAGRADNVRTLLLLGYGPDEVSARFDDGRKRDPAPRTLPLQAAREALAVHGERALAVVDVLLAAGADPHRLRWFPPRGGPPATAELVAAFDRKLAEASAAHDPLSTEFVGLRLEYFEGGGSEQYARFLLRNAGSVPVAIRLWHDDGASRLDGTYAMSHLLSRPRGAKAWTDPLVLEHGMWPSHTLTIAPGEEHAVLAQVDVQELIRAPWLEYRLWFVDEAGGEHLSAPFVISGPQTDIETESRKVARRWYQAR